MKILKINKGLKGSLTVASDKSMTHRAVILSALAKGESHIYSPLLSEDVRRTITAFQAMSVNIKEKKSELIIVGSDFQLKKASKALNMGNSGTSSRLLMGVLSGQNFESMMYGDSSLSQRPMSRVVKPLREMGARISYNEHRESLPLTIQGQKGLTSIDYKMPIASAQVKTALLLSGLQAEGETRLIEKEVTRNHTEQMLPLFSAEIQVNDKEIKLKGRQNLRGAECYIPADISSAAFWIVAALIIPDSEILLKNVCINPTRAGILEVVHLMEGKCELLNIKEAEEIADIHVSYTENLKAVEISGNLIPRLIDEIPIICLLASQAEGETLIKDAQELRVKESDRIKKMVEMLSDLGVSISEKEDGMIIKGKARLRSGKINSLNDHRIAMTAVIAGLIAEEGMEVINTETIKSSYPDFFKDLETLCQ
ncbi:MAG: 3-phosphoshikimate 1-carboxyvinyltransferase [Lactovum sp.]